MIRLARRTSLLVTISLFASAMTAHAECAWILWVRGPWIEGYWQILGAQLSAQECTKNLEDVVLKYKLARKTTSDLGGRKSSSVIYTAFPTSLIRVGRRRGEQRRRTPLASLAPHPPRPARDAAHSGPLVPTSLDRRSVLLS